MCARPRNEKKTSKRHIPSHPTRDVCALIGYIWYEAPSHPVTSHTGCVLLTLEDGKPRFVTSRHIPHGMCAVRKGLKKYDHRHIPSHPTRDVCDRIPYQCNCLQRHIPSHPTRDVCVSWVINNCGNGSHPVTSHTGCVSRNANSNT